MTPNTDRLKHGIHNEHVCEYLELKKEIFADWMVTSAFYASLHFISHKIFPFDMPAIAGKSTKIINIDQYFNYLNANSLNSKRKSKHELVSELVFKTCNSLSEDYDWLLDTSMNARYHYYHQDKEIAAKAIRLMRSIKKGCVTDQQLKAL